MIRLPRIIWSGLMPACWSPFGYLVRGALVVLSLSWLAAGLLDVPRHALNRPVVGVFMPIDPACRLAKQFN